MKNYFNKEHNNKKLLCNILEKAILRRSMKDILINCNVICLKFDILIYEFLFYIN